MEDVLALKVEHLNVNYDKISVLWDVSFSIRKGGLIAVLGPNGAGKSTLLKALLGFIKPLSGRITFFGQPYEKLRNSVAYVPQRSAVDWDFPVSVFDVVLMGCYGRKGFFGTISKEDRSLVEKVLKQVGLESLADRQISELSGGQQQRVFVARALVQQAEIYLMDEPFSAIDMATEKSLIAILKGLKAEGKTIFVVHHDLPSAMKYFDSALLLNTSLISYGSISEVFQKENLEKAYGASFPFLDS